VSRHHSRVLDELQSFFIAACHCKALTYRVEVSSGYRDFKIPRVRLADCFIVVRMISRDLVGKMSSIYGACVLVEDSPG
jgi:hypothetical protein